ncbi:hypothetical protein B0T25DRAFT_56344 [Lasiosphaeria hispida]|uniref:C2H2-type domain-containing protein n=1 Tax=Lasiosphaeria hispida TaxID=260671 RepID=A0AAJ0MKV2_9PEZI|nr:hypothetical protein B0T25DRAFT_56344 [Lasiosphaeria hispida]
MPQIVKSLLSSGASKNEAGEASGTGAGVRARPDWVHRFYQRAKERMSGDRRPNSPDQHAESDEPQSQASEGDVKLPCSRPQTAPEISGAGPEQHGGNDEAAFTACENPKMLQAVEVVPNATLYSIGVRIFNTLSDLENSETTKSSVPFRSHIVTESERFTLWAQSLGLGRQGHASLDYKVRDANVVRSYLQDLLEGLWTHLDELRSIAVGERQPLYREHGEEDSLSESSSQDASGHQDSNTSEASSAGSEHPSSSSSFHEVEFRQQSITDAIDALYSLATNMRNPRNRPQRTTRELIKHVPQELRAQYVQERENMEVMIISHIHRQSLSGVLKQSGGVDEPSAPAGEPSELRGEPGPSPDIAAGAPMSADELEQYASPSSFLVRRIGIANARRKQQFVYWKEHAAKIKGDPTTQNAKQTTKPNVKDPLPQEDREVPQPQMVSGVASSMPRQSLATSATRQDDAAFARTCDLQSVISHRSRVSTAFTVKGTKLEWPPSPAYPASARPKFFTCPYCHVICPEEYLTKDAWRSHIIHDLQPYQCTYEERPDANRLYGSHQEWLDHENQHTQVWHCHRHTCEFETSSEYIKHTLTKPTPMQGQSSALPSSYPWQSGHPVPCTDPAPCARHRLKTSPVCRNIFDTTSNALPSLACCPKKQTRTRRLQISRLTVIRSFEAVAEQLP